MYSARSVGELLDDTISIGSARNTKPLRTLILSKSQVDRQLSKNREKKGKTISKDTFITFKTQTGGIETDDDVKSHLTYDEGKDSQMSWDNMSYQQEFDMSSNRSQGSWGSVETARSQVSMMTAREMVQQIEDSVRRGKPRPMFVPKLSELPQSKVTWNGELHHIGGKRPPKGMLGITDTWHERQRVVNIMGCHQPLELLLAKADERARKQKKNMRKRESVAASAKKHLDAVLKQKYTRAERYANLMRFQQLQMGWMRIIPMIKFYQNFKVCVERARQNAGYNKACLMIGTWFKIALLAKRERRMRVFYNSPAITQIALRLRILKKRRAVRIIISNLTDYKNDDSMKRIIHRFVHAVHRIQACMHAFMRCKRSRVYVLHKRWVRLEIKYISKQLAKKAKLKRTGGRKLLSSGKLPVDEKTKIEMGKQQDKFDAAEAALERAVAENQKTGLLTKKDKFLEMQRMSIPESIVMARLVVLVEHKRKDFIRSQKDRAARMQRSLLDFNPGDALALLTEHGAADEIAKRMERANIKFQPFVLHSTVSDEALLSMIEHEHLQLGTFTVKTRGVPELEKRWRILKEKDDKEQEVAHLDAEAGSKGVSQVGPSKGGRGTGGGKVSQIERRKRLEMKKGMGDPDAEGRKKTDPEGKARRAVGGIGVGSPQKIPDF